MFGAGFILPILAITLGWNGMKAADVGWASNRGVAKAGFILRLVALGITLALGALIGISYLTEGSSPATVMSASQVEAAVAKAFTDETGGQYSVSCSEPTQSPRGYESICAVVESPSGRTANIRATQGIDGKLSMASAPNS